MNTEIKEVFNYLNSHQDKLTVWQLNFVRSTERYFRRKKELSEKQLYILNELRKYV